ncbi:MAG: T9SS C-terminal target domain-containing protein [Ignavibacteriae bacterium]|nr:MAG: T9SS C-terminal target domain-containing protein [Ignavibacteriota bacterium]
MKTILLTHIFILLICVTSSSQVKVNISLSSCRIENYYVVQDVIATIPQNQVWRVGQCNIRIRYNVSGGFIPVPLPFTPMCESLYYYQIYTVYEDYALEFFIFRTGNKRCCLLTPGSHILGKIYFMRTYDADTLIDSIKEINSELMDSITVLNYGTQWTKTNPAPCYYSTIGINNNYKTTPDKFKLYQNYPNPVTGPVIIKFEIYEVTNDKLDSNPGKSDVVKIIVYDAVGKEVETLVNKRYSPGTYEVQWNALDYPSGVYFYKMECGEFSDVKKVVVVK